MRLLPVAIVLLLSSSTIPAQNVPNTTQSPPTVSASERDILPNKSPPDMMHGL
jgi:hypothetical protein